MNAQGQGLTDYLEIIARRKKQKIKDPCYDMVVVPVNFSTTEKRNMLANLKQIVDGELVALDLEKHAGLVLALRANPSFIWSLKLQIGEEAGYDKVIARYKADGFGPDVDLKSMKVVPVNFGKEHKSMLGHAKMILESDGGHIAINPVFDKLITSLRTAVDADGTLDKECTSYNDIFDAFRLALRFYQFNEQ